MKRFLYLFMSHHRWARKIIGGRWVKDRRPGHLWVQWNDGGMLDEILGWPINPKEYEHEDYRRPISQANRGPDETA